MAETQQQPQKRLRDEFEEELVEEEANTKRQKPYNNILSLLDLEEEGGEEEPDLTAIFNTLEQELGSEPLDLDQVGSGSTAEDDVESVMRHLLEASDDELGIPNRDDDSNNGENIPFSLEENIPFAFADNMWELEDEAANYYTVLQSELFM